MFPFPHDHQSEYLGFEVSSTPQQEDFMQQDLIMMPDSLDVLPSHDLQGFSLSNINISEANVNNKDTDAHERKIMRRDNERQRRQLMAIRTASLRSLLPLESIKGKRSLSEHINEAVNYIKQLKEKIQELNAKREELRRVHQQYYSSSAHDFSPEITGNLGTKSTSNIMVGPTCWGGVEIVVSTSSTNCSELEGFALSGVLKALLAEGLTIVECASTTVNQRLFHTIQCEVEDLACQNLPELQLKLNYLCNSG
ncbi:PREDICTED: transcription factor bHLH36-like isoform X2 [Fragaria vesca subsp. vesca]|uniref:transcription factor bHLH36-like isoform X2 n=1 Tax=Fragaria vesca subsp. vesca TaxID=101020 RepID=UPI0002C32D42|nr:PREDICTED: transcription factor bHLH36-like isoform X2 [Fragaria vesca subsp. vesca]